MKAPETTTKIKAGFAVLNTAVGAMLVALSFIMLVSKKIDAQGFIPLIIGLTLLIAGIYALYAKRKSKENDKYRAVKSIKLINIICFVISVLILAIICANTIIYLIN